MIHAREYQHIANDHLWGYFDHYTGNPIVAMPTGTGKSVVQAMFLQRVFANFPNQRVLCMTHVKELIQQNADRLRALWPTAPIGIYSAALKRKETFMPITFGGVMSIKNAVADLGWIDLVIIDECHLVSPNADTTYQRIIAELRARNPNLKVIGFTATWWRLGQGNLTDSGLFTDICINMTDMLSFNWFLSEGYLAPLIPKRTDVKIDVSGVGINNGDFILSQLQTATDKVTYGALKEALEYAGDRRSWLVFCAGNENAENAAAILNSFGITATFVHDKVPDKERDARIAGFRDGTYRAICNNNILTTGFDHPWIDCIVMLRKTMSPGLWVQMLGRGTRPVYAPGFDLDYREGRVAAMQASGKTNCLVLDFAHNTRDLGPINDPVIPKSRKGGGGDAPVKICDVCGVYNHASVRFCIGCGHEFEFAVGFQRHADDQELIRSEQPQMDWFPVHNVIYNKHTVKGSGTPMLKVTYVSRHDNGIGTSFFFEWIGLEHKQPFMLHKAHDWWRARDVGGVGIPPTVDEALKHTKTLRHPRKIRVWTNRKYPEILNYEYE